MVGQTATALTVFQPVCGAAGTMPHKKTLYLVWQPAVFCCSCLFCWGTSMKPITIRPHKNLNGWVKLCFSCTSCMVDTGWPVWGWRGGLHWVLDGPGYFVYRQASWDHQVGDYSTQGWLKPIRLECVQGKSGPFSPLPSKALSFFRLEGLRGSCFCPLQKVWGKEEAYSGQEWTQQGPSRVFLLWFLCAWRFSSARQISLGPLELQLVGFVICAWCAHGHI